MGPHSIVEAVVFMEFFPGLQNAMASLMLLKEDLKELLPKYDTTSSINIVISDNVPAMQPGSNVSGLQLSRMAPDGTIEWILAVDLNAIHVHSLKYTRWSEIWPKFRQILEFVFKRISRSPVALMAVGMKWIDQFALVGNVETYRADELLRPDSQHINPAAFRSGSRWHCHTGWFDHETMPGRAVLNQLNLDSGNFNIGGAQRVGVTIDHTLQMRAENPVQLAPLAPSATGSLSALSHLMEGLHRANKQILKSLLTESALSQISLQKEGRRP